MSTTGSSGAEIDRRIMKVLAGWQSVLGRDEENKVMEHLDAKEYATALKTLRLFLVIHVMNTSQKLDDIDNMIAQTQPEEA